jgi:hypothetical protein
MDHDKTDAFVSKKRGHGQLWQSSERHTTRTPNRGAVGSLTIEFGL